MSESVEDNLPLLRRELDGTFAWRDSATISCRQFLADVYACAESLPDAVYACNVCEDQYCFTVAFCAAILRGQINLLPANHRKATVGQTLQQYPDSYLLHDSSFADELLPAIDAQDVSWAAGNSGDSSDIPELAKAAPAAIVFTSGSTGNSVNLVKSWGELTAGADINRELLDATGICVNSCISTVPPWHMYGLEWSLLVPLAADIAVYSGSSFYPADVARALSAAPCPVWLLTTPLHLRALLRAELALPGADLVMSATSPLQEEIAAQAEDKLHGRVLEIYGCSEAGSMASRWPATDAGWSFLPAFQVNRSETDVTLNAPHLSAAVALADALAFDADGRFAILGRQNDLVKVAGKRTSLQHLTNTLLGIDGIQDGIFFVRSPESADKPLRLAAFFVSQSRTVEDLRTELGECLDPLFMPRPLQKLDALPREATGKLPRARLLELLDESRRSFDNE